MNLADEFDGGELHAMSSGEDFADVILSLASRVGSCSVVVCTGAAHSDPIRAMQASKYVASLQLIACYAVGSMNQAQYDEVCGAMGSQMRAARTHAKFALIEGERGTISVLTSANLNRNRRSESYMITDDPGCAAMLREHVTALETHGDDPGQKAGYYWNTCQQAMGAQDEGDLSLEDAMRRFL